MELHELVTNLQRQSNDFKHDLDESHRIWVLSEENLLNAKEKIKTLGQELRLKELELKAYMDGAKVVEDVRRELEDMRSKRTLLNESK